MLLPRLTVPLHRNAAFHIFIFFSIGCFYYPLGTDNPSWKKNKSKEKKKKTAWGNKSEIETPNNDAYKTRNRTNTKRRHNALSLLLTQTHRYRQTHKYAEGWQRRDRPWMITSRPSGPSPQILLSGSKSGLSLYANQPSFKPTNHSPPHWQPLPITALRLTMPSKINIKPSGRQKRSDMTENRRGTSCVEY